MLSAKRGKGVAKSSLGRACQATHTQPLRVINVNKNAVYPTAVDKAKKEEIVTKSFILTAKQPLK
ncbi:hypothetical protein IQ230_00285 [Gloeocapsopsis crepidinum LEGE 06123]|uniref:Uncharacterized protein n=1 Tax=Gloeocapsopsis crepidinum LEGE 06123 TaxID=588587 RepID=A0ABR9UKK5_9CHRO|nr:hypothetical protein [Gloeocapsopsis crepidinum LEGE 06123]